MEDTMTWIEFINRRIEDPLGILRYGDNTPLVKITGYNIDVQAPTYYRGNNTWEQPTNEREVTVRFTLVQPDVEDSSSGSGSARDEGESDD